jgi:hypothetical protein
LESLAIIPLGSPIVQRGFATHSTWPVHALTCLWQGDPVIAEHKDGQRRPWSSFAILTTEANRLVAQIHNRMPVILSPEDEATWLNPEATPAQAQACLKPFPAHLLRIAAVSSKVNSPANNSPELLQRVDMPESAPREEETAAEAGLLFPDPALV